MTQKPDYVCIGRIGYLGSLKPKVKQFLLGVYGSKMRKAHLFGEQHLSREDALVHYGESYYRFLKENKELRGWLVKTASDVYDTAKSNIMSGLDYRRQETAATHLHDIAVRRALTRIILEEKGADYDSNNLPEIPLFEGSHLVEIRGIESEGHMLNPGNVPFYKPEAVLQPARKGWWKPQSIEDFWQSNKVIQLERNWLLLLLEEDSLMPPGQDYCTKEQHLDKIVLQWCSFQTEKPTILGIGTIKNEEAPSYYVEVDYPFESICYLSMADYYRRLYTKFMSWDLLMRVGQQLPKNTIKRLRRFAKEVEFVS